VQIKELICNTKRERATTDDLLADGVEGLKVLCHRRRLKVCTQHIQTENDTQLSENSGKSTRFRPDASAMVDAQQRQQTHVYKRRWGGQHNPQATRHRKSLVAHRQTRAYVRARLGSWPPCSASNVVIIAGGTRSVIKRGDTCTTQRRQLHAHLQSES
jgi:hypothetical protein